MGLRTFYVQESKNFKLLILLKLCRIKLNSYLSKGKNSELLKSLSKLEEKSKLTRVWFLYKNYMHRWIKVEGEYGNFNYVHSQKFL